MEWIRTGRADVLRFRRPNGWEVITNFGDEPFGLDGADVLIASAEISSGDLPGESTAWLDTRASGAGPCADGSTEFFMESESSSPNPFDE